MGEALDHRSLLTSARAELLEGQGRARSGVPDHVLASWQRSVDHGVSPGHVESPYVSELDFGARLVRCAQPVIEQLGEELADVPTCVALTDSRARIVARRDSSPWFSRLLDRVHFAQGFDYAEASVGTNGVGTVLEFGASVQIVGAEHFVDALQLFACAGAPVRDPFSGRIEGVLDISCRSDDSSPIMHSLVRAAARRVERNLVLDRNHAQQALFEAFARVDARARGAVVGVGPRVLLSNPAMQTLLGSQDQAALSDHMRFLTGRRQARVDDRVELPSGVRVRLRGSTTAFGDDVAGMVGVVTLCHDPTPPAVRVDPPGTAGGAAGSPASPSPTSPSPAFPPSSASSSSSSSAASASASASASARRGGSTDGRHGADTGSPAWRSAAAGVATALRTGRPILVLGEPASGRQTLLADTFRALHPAGTVIAVDARHLDTTAATVATAVLGPVDVPTLIVLCDLDRVPPASGAVLAAALAGRSGPRVRLAATAVPARTPHDHPLLALFDESVTVPPLRHRSTDLLTLARTILDDVEPRRQVRLSADAVRVLSRHSWPGNIGELREVMVAALRQRPVGTIEPDDLPAFCESVPRSALREVDRVERDAIVLALREANGNRKVAAGALGIARSTLYRKIRQYGVTT